jgi:hypothetical protein
MNNSKPLMNELNKVVRTTKPDMKIFIADALTGNDAIDRAKKFYNHTEFDGVISRPCFPLLEAREMVKQLQMLYRNTRVNGPMLYLC